MNEDMNTPYRVHPLPPRIPPAAEDPVPRPPASTGIFSGFAGDFKAMDQKPTLLTVVDSLLKHPARVTHALIVGRSARTAGILLATLLLCMLVYGVVMGSFSGGEQWWMVPLKVGIGTLLSAAICLPSLYIFGALSGSDRSFPEVAGLLLQSLTLGSILLLGLAPVTWIFSQSTNAVAFMGFLHLLFWAVGAGFALLLMKAAFRHVSRDGTRILVLWNLIFILVVLQMTTALRPLVGRFDGYQWPEKKFFATHWYDCLDADTATPPRSGR